MFLFYSLLLTLGIILMLPVFLWDALRHGKYVEGLRERAGGVKVDAGGRPVIWLHCVSVGETQAARPLARALVERFPGHALVVSTTTRTGQRVAREAFSNLAPAVIYFPFDWAWSVRRALDAVRPSVILLMETELWFRFLRECAERNIPVALVNGRLSERSFRRYKLIRGFARRALDTLSLALAQTKDDASRLVELGLAPERVKVTGNVKFDLCDDPRASAVTDELRARFALGDGRPLVVAASTHAPEERVVLDAYRQLSASPVGAGDDRHDGATRPRLLIAPRHPERFAEVASLLDSTGLTWARRGDAPAAGDAHCDVILLDTVGELRAVYPLAEVVFVGGSISETGGHNVLEPAHAARCVVTGPHTFNFKEIVRRLLEADALVQLPATAGGEMTDALARTLRGLLSDDARRRRLGANALAFLEQNRGATTRTVELLTPIIKNRGQRSEVSRAAK